jgi:hypothetical protein
MAKITFIVKQANLFLILVVSRKVQFLLGNTVSTTDSIKDKGSLNLVLITTKVNRPVCPSHSLKNLVHVALDTP